MESANRQNNAQQESARIALPADYAPPEVHELGKCEDLTLGNPDDQFWEPWGGGYWC